MPGTRPSTKDQGSGIGVQAGASARRAVANPVVLPRRSAPPRSGPRAAWAVATPVAMARDFGAADARRPRLRPAVPRRPRPAATRRGGTTPRRPGPQPDPRGRDGGPVSSGSAPRRGAGVVDRSGLENRRAFAPRGFESHPLRHERLGRLRHDDPAWRGRSVLDGLARDASTSLPAMNAPGRLHAAIPAASRFRGGSDHGSAEPRTGRPTPDDGHVPAGRSTGTMGGPAPFMLRPRFCSPPSRHLPGEVDPGDGTALVGSGSPLRHGLDARRARCRRCGYICLKRGPSPPSGGSQRMFSSGHFTAQVMQWRQFEAERTTFSPSQR